MNRIKQKDGAWWVEDADGLRRATDLEVDLWQRLVSVNETVTALHPVIQRLMNTNISYLSTLIHLVATLHRARREDAGHARIGEHPHRLRARIYYENTRELRDTLKVSTQLIADATVGQPKKD